MGYSDSRKVVQNWRKNPWVKMADGDFEQKTKQNTGTIFDVYNGVRKTNHHHEEDEYERTIDNLGP
jgi:hypothetical protein